MRKGRDSEGIDRPTGDVIYAAKGTFDIDAMEDWVEVLAVPIFRVFAPLLLERPPIFGVRQD